VLSRSHRRCFLHCPFANRQSDNCVTVLQCFWGTCRRQERVGFWSS
jgi:hypothetical protein